MWPNWELNERNTVVAFADFGNRGSSSEADAAFPVRLDLRTEATGRVFERFLDLFELDDNPSPTTPEGDPS
jgi:hypothetical protein